MDELIDRIYRAVIAPDTWTGVVRDICRAFAGHSAVLAFSENDTVLSAISIPHGVFEDPAVVDSYFSHYGAIDGAVPLFASLPAGKMVAVSRVWSKRRLARDEFYNDFFRKLGLADSVGGNLIRDERGTGMFTLQRDPLAGNFTRDDIAALERLVPHLRRAVQLHRALAPSRRAAVAFADGLEKMPFGLVAIDDRGRVWHLNKTAQDIVDRRDGLTVSRDSGLSTVDRTAAQRLAQLIGSVLFGEERHAGGQLQVMRPGRAPYGVLVAPMPMGPASIFDTVGQRGALVLISDPDRSRNGDLAAAMMRYGLTPAELDLLGDLAAGRTLQEHCERRRVTINTGKFHLKSLFSKTGARGQADLVRISLTAMDDR
ncbi:helix-turn-helix transcriptional regulator [soil metagenome]